jgi:hypothetical protein
MGSYDIAYLPEGNRNVGSRITNIINEDFGNYSKLEGILLEFLGRRRTGGVKFEIKVF